MKGISLTVSQGMEEIASGTKEILVSTQAVVSLSEKLHDVVLELKNGFGKFIV